MRLRTRPILFARLLADAATTRPFMRALLEQRRAGELDCEPVVAPPAPPAVLRPIPRAA